jgi:hypothetical protein
VTVTVTPVAEIPPLAAVMSAEPTSLAVTTPSAIDATPGLDEDHVMPALPRDRLSLVYATAVRVVVLPDESEIGAAGVISIRATELSGSVV